MSIRTHYLWRFKCLHNWYATTQTNKPTQHSKHYNNTIMTIVDSCDNSTGCSYKTLTCDDHSLCTQDTCNTTTGCVFTDVSFHEVSAFFVQCALSALCAVPIALSWNALRAVCRICASRSAPYTCALYICARAAPDIALFTLCVAHFAETTENSKIGQIGVWRKKRYQQSVMTEVYVQLIVATTLLVVFIWR